MTKERSVFSIKTSVRRFALALGILGLCAMPAAASTITIDSSASTFSITADNLLPTSEGTTIHDVTTLGGGWTTIAGTNWVSPLANQSSGDSVTSGTVTYQTTFNVGTTPLASSSLSIDFEADDWAQILLNGNVIYSGPSACSSTSYAPGVTCSGNPGQWTSATDLLNIATNELTTGTNTLTFIVSNTGGGSDSGGGPTGLDAAVTVNYSAVPEPSSLLLLGTGMLTAAGFVRRRFMRS